MLENLMETYPCDSIYKLDSLISDIRKNFNIEVREEEYALILITDKEIYCIDFNKINEDNILITNIYKLPKEMSLGKFHE